MINWVILFDNLVYTRNNAREERAHKDWPSCDSGLALPPRNVSAEDNQDASNSQICLGQVEDIFTRRGGGGGISWEHDRRGSLS